MDKDPLKAHQAFEYFLEHQQTVASSTRLFDGVSELLKQLNDSEIPLGMVTGRHSRDLHIMLEAHSLQSHFKIMVSDDQVSLPKPNPEGIFKAAKHLGILPKNTLYIGDSPSDVEAAHNAGATAIAVVWDSHANREALSEKNPKYLIEDPHEIWDVFEAFSQK
jgi:HAD superfamily hydrolase (TIGR01549 family)